MKLIIRFFFIILIYSSTTLHSQDIIRFRVSKPYCLINFLETMQGSNGTSSTLRKFVEERIPEGDTTLYGIVRRYSSLTLDYNFVRQDYPSSRHRNRTTKSILLSAAIQSDNLKDFNERTIGILPNSDQQKLLKVLEDATPYYDRIIWNENEGSMAKMIETFKPMLPEVNEIFNKLRVFYNSSWTSDFSFIVCLYPIPGKKGNTSAQPHGNALAVGMLTEESDIDGRMGVIIHEMAHVLYDEQPLAIQIRLDDHIQNHSSPYRQLAYTFLDEALATACGNGWAFEQLTGRLDTTSWYNNTYIDGFAHAIYPEVKSYIAAGKPMDQQFINFCIEVFEKTFPRAIDDLNILLNEIYFYNDAADTEERNSIRLALTRYFNCYSYYTSTPVAHQNSVNSLKKREGTQLIIVHRNYDENLTMLREIFPEVKKYLVLDGNYALTFRAEGQKPVLIIKVDKIEMLDDAFAKLKKQQYILSNQPYLKL